MLHRHDLPSKLKTFADACMMSISNIFTCLYRRHHPKRKTAHLKIPVIKHRQTNKKAQLSLTNTRDAKTCQKLLQFDVLTTLSLLLRPESAKSREIH